MANDAGVSRRGFLRGAAGGTAVASVGAAAAQETTDSGGETMPDLEGYLDDANNYDGITDQRDSDSVTVDVGAGENGLAFGPAAVHVDNGATVTWEWTGEGGMHNVIAEDGSFDSGELTDSGTYEFTFEEDGIYQYYCDPHKASGMKGVIVVGEEYPTTQATGNQTTESAGNATESAGNETESGGESGGGGGGPPDFGGYLEGANNYEGSVADQRGSDSVTVDVGAGSGGLAFGPAAVHVDNGATVTWEWTGEGGAHNVVAEDETFNSGDPQGEGTFEYTFEEDGIYNYYCSPHKASGMLGSVVVGTDYPTIDQGGGSGLTGLPNSVKDIGIAASVVMSSTLALAYFFIKYGGDYETPS